MVKINGEKKLFIEKFNVNFKQNKQNHIKKCTLDFILKKFYFWTWNLNKQA